MSKNISEELFSLDQSLLGDRIKECNYPWEILPRIGEYIIELGEKLPADKYDQIKDYVWVAKNAKISDSADIQDHVLSVKIQRFVTVHLSVVRHLSEITV